MFASALAPDAVSYIPYTCKSDDNSLPRIYKTTLVCSVFHLTGYLSPLKIPPKEE